MLKSIVLTPLSFIIFIVSLLVSVIVLYNDTEMFLDSLIAATLFAGLIWATYVMLRICILATKKNKP